MSVASVCGLLDFANYLLGCFDSVTSHHTLRSPLNNKAPTVLSASCIAIGIYMFLCFVFQRETEISGDGFYSEPSGAPTLRQILLCFLVVIELLDSHFCFFISEDSVIVFVANACNTPSKEIANSPYMSGKPVILPDLLGVMSIYVYLPA